MANAAAGRHGRAGRHLQRHPVAGLRRRPLRHRRDAARRRGLHQQEVQDGHGWTSSRARSPSSPGPPGGRAAATRSGSPRRAPTSSPSTSARDYRRRSPYPLATEEDLAETVTAGRGAGPADRRHRGRRPRRRRAAGRGRRRASPSSAGSTSSCANAGHLRHPGRGTRSRRRRSGRTILDINLTGRLEHLQGGRRAAPDRRAAAARSSAPARRRASRALPYLAPRTWRPSTAWSASCETLANELAPAQHPGQHRAPDRGGHPDDQRAWAACAPC